MPKPKAGVIYSGQFHYTDERGAIDHSAGLARVRLTNDYLWVSSRLSVPVASIRQIDNQGKAIGIHFVNVLSGDEELLCLGARNWWGTRNFGANQDLAMRLRDAQKTARSIEEFASEFVDERGDLTIGCEVCGEKPALEVEYGWFFCVGIFPFAGAYKWTPDRRVLCRRHSNLACFANNVKTGLLGYWGFPGVFVAPYRL
jgi:hypothetical protein